MLINDIAVLLLQRLKERVKEKAKLNLHDAECYFSSYAATIVEFCCFQLLLDVFVRRRRRFFC